VSIALVDDDRSLVTAPTIAGPPTLRSTLSIMSLFVPVTTVHF